MIKTTYYLRNLRELAIQKTIMQTALFTRPAKGVAALLRFWSSCWCFLLSR